jgi:malate synthase
MTSPFMRAYSLECIRTCHARGTFAIGGMSAYIPVKSDPAANELALAKVREDKRREARDGHDGTWVAHPGLVPVAMEEFNAVLGSRPNQIERRRDDVLTTAAQLVQPPAGTITEEGLRMNIRVSVQYIEAWLGGLGCVPLYNLMEDAATAEISRTQIWQWIHHERGVLEDGRRITVRLFRSLLAQELDRIRTERGSSRFSNGRFLEASQLLDRLVSAPTLAEFLTVPAYELLDRTASDGSWMTPRATAVNAI